MRFVKIPAVLICQQCQIYAVSYFVSGAENREAVSIVEPQLIICRYFGWFDTFRCVCDV